MAPRKKRATNLLPAESNTRTTRSGIKTLPPAKPATKKQTKAPMTKSIKLQSPLENLIRRSSRESKLKLTEMIPKATTSKVTSPKAITPKRKSTENVEEPLVLEGRRKSMEKQTKKRVSKSKGKCVLEPLNSDDCEKVMDSNLYEFSGTPDVQENVKIQGNLKIQESSRVQENPKPQGYPSTHKFFQFREFPEIRESPGFKNYPKIQELTKKQESSKKQKSTKKQKSVESSKIQNIREQTNIQETTITKVYGHTKIEDHTESHNYPRFQKREQEEMKNQEQVKIQGNTKAGENTKAQENRKIQENAKAQDKNKEETHLIEKSSYNYKTFGKFRCLLENSNCNNSNMKSANCTPKSNDEDSSSQSEINLNVESVENIESVIGVSVERKFSDADIQKRNSKEVQDINEKDKIALSWEKDVNVLEVENVTIKNNNLLTKSDDDLMKNDNDIDDSLTKNDVMIKCFDISMDNENILMSENMEVSIKNKRERKSEKFIMKEEYLIQDKESTKEKEELMKEKVPVQDEEYSKVKFTMDIENEEKKLLDNNEYLVKKKNDNQDIERCEQDEDPSKNLRSYQSEISVCEAMEITESTMREVIEKEEIKQYEGIFQDVKTFDVELESLDEEMKTLNEKFEPSNKVMESFNEKRETYNKDIKSFKENISSDMLIPVLNKKLNPFLEETRILDEKNQSSNDAMTLNETKNISNYTKQVSNETKHVSSEINQNLIEIKLSNEINPFNESSKPLIETEQVLNKINEFSKSETKHSLTISTDKSAETSVENIAEEKMEITDLQDDGNREVEITERLSNLTVDPAKSSKELNSNDETFNMNLKELYASLKGLKDKLKENKADGKGDSLDNLKGRNLKDLKKEHSFKGHSIKEFNIKEQVLKGNTSKEHDLKEKSSPKENEEKHGSCKILDIKHKEEDFEAITSEYTLGYVEEIIGDNQDIEVNYTEEIIKEKNEVRISHDSSLDSTAEIDTSIFTSNPPCISSPVVNSALDSSVIHLVNSAGSVDTTQRIDSSIMTQKDVYIPSPSQNDKYPLQKLEDASPKMDFIDSTSDRINSVTNVNNFSNLGADSASYSIDPEAVDSPFDVVMDSSDSSSLSDAKKAKTVDAPEAEHETNQKTKQSKQKDEKRGKKQTQDDFLRSLYTPQKEKLTKVVPKKKADVKTDLQSKADEIKKFLEQKISESNTLNVENSIRRSNRIKSMGDLKKRSSTKPQDEKKKNLDTDVLESCDNVQNVLDISTTTDVELKPVKVKSRWRRSSELEMSFSPNVSKSNSPLTTADGLQIPGAFIPLVSEKDKEKNNEEVEKRLKQFIHLKENIYLTDRMTCKEAKKMTCDCFLTLEETERGDFGCGEDCLNRLLMIEWLVFFLFLFLCNLHFFFASVEIYALWEIAVLTRGSKKLNLHLVKFSKQRRKV